MALLSFLASKCVGITISKIPSQHSYKLLYFKTFGENWIVENCYTWCLKNLNLYSLTSCDFQTHSTDIHMVSKNCSKTDPISFALTFSSFYSLYFCPNIPRYCTVLLPVSYSLIMPKNSEVYLPFYWDFILLSITLYLYFHKICKFIHNLFLRLWVF